MPLRVKVKQLEAKKREIDKQVENLHGSIRIFEQNGNVSDEDRSPYAKEVSDAMVEILTDEHPLHRNVILARIRERGIHIGGQKPVNTIGSYLSLDYRFKNAGKGIWTLGEEPIAVDNIPDILGGMESKADDLPF